MIKPDGIYPSTCWECSTRCGSLVTVENGHVAKVGPNQDHPASKGAFCVKGIRALPELTYSRNRIRSPMRRAGPRGSGQWDDISWDDALDEMADRLLEVRTEHGPESLIGAVSSAFFSRGAMVALLMRSLGSPNWMMNQDLCGGCRALSDKVTGLGIVGGEDVDNTRCALIVGRNPSAADPVQWMGLKRAKKNGAKFVVIDPAETPAAKLADIWLRPKPGSDAAIALGMIYVIIKENLYDRAFVKKWTHGFEDLKQRAADYPPARAAKLSGVSPEDIIDAARLYAAGPSCFVSGHGIDAFSNGVQTFRAFHCLVAITGNVDRRGGNIRVKRPRGFRNYIDILHDPNFALPPEVARKTLGADAFPLWAGPKGWQTSVHNPTALDAILTGKPYPVRAMYVSGVNIVVTYPDTRKVIAALKSLDFLAVASHMMTPTSEIADIVLPKTTGLEEEEVSLEPAAQIVCYTNPVKLPEGKARSDFDFTTDLARRLEARGVDTRKFFPWKNKHDFNEYLLGDEIDWGIFRKQGWAPFDFKIGNFEEVGFKTASGKIELRSQTLDDIGVDPLPAYEKPRAEQSTAIERQNFPLILITGAREKTYHHSRYRDQAWARKISPFPLLQVHPADAERSVLTDGDWISVETAGFDGACKLKVTVTTETDAGTVRTGMGWWLPEVEGPEKGALDVNVNVALSYNGPWDPVTGSADTKGLPCRITPLAKSEIPMRETA
ncbi:MAG: molybdopterin-dependent oxidoreductase [Pseudomonadota bacterium]|nr:molybdopterin-dependent oxidoreductase [Pseudomonadota bacterium]